MLLQLCEWSVWRGQLLPQNSPAQRCEMSASVSCLLSPSQDCVEFNDWTFLVSHDRQPRRWHQSIEELTRDSGQIPCAVLVSIAGNGRNAWVLVAEALVMIRGLPKQARAKMLRLKTKTFASMPHIKSRRNCLHRLPGLSAADPREEYPSQTDPRLASPCHNLPATFSPNLWPPLET